MQNLQSLEEGSTYAKMKNPYWSRTFFLGSLLTVSGMILGCGTVNNQTLAIPRTSIAPTRNPLVARYFIASTCAGEVMVEFGLDASYGRSTSWQPTPGGHRTVSFLVAGMKASTTYHMRPTMRCFGQTWTGNDQTFTTGPLPPQNAIGLTVTRPVQFSAPQQGVELLNLADIGPSSLQAGVSDLDGNVIWYYQPADGETVLPLKPLSNGNMIADVSSKTSGTYTLREIDLAGDTIREISSTTLAQLLSPLGRSVTFYQFHHDILELPNGHIILLASMKVPYNDLPGYPGTTNVIGDVLIDLDSTWTPVWFWSTFDHLDVNRHLQGLPDWTHSNALLYTPNDGNLVLSIRHQSWVIKIDYANGNGTGDILWKLGEGGDFTLAGGDPSQWFYAQHYPNILSTNGSQLIMALIDNGNFRVVDSSGTQCGSGVPCYTRAVIFNVDEATHSASVAWQKLPGFFTNWGGSIDEIDGDNVEFDLTAPFPSPTPPYFLPKSRVQEVTQDGNGTLVWQMDINGANGYRAYRIPSLYPDVTWTQ